MPSEESPYSQVSSLSLSLSLAWPPTEFDYNSPCLLCRRCLCETDQGPATRGGWIQSHPPHRRRPQDQDWLRLSLLPATRFCRPASSLSSLPLSLSLHVLC